MVNKEDETSLFKDNYEVEFFDNPSQETLRELAEKHSTPILTTKYGNLNKITINKARFAEYTYIIAPEEDQHLYSSKVISPKKAEDLIKRQREYIEDMGELIVIDGYLGVGDRAVSVEWLYSLEGANVAGMQQVLSMPRKFVETEEELKKPFEPTLKLVMTPWFFPEDMPGNMAMIVDLENFQTYVMGADYFGESKKGALRMLNEYVYQRGGLVLHAGAKAVKVGDEEETMTIMGLSGTGKTTTTFSKQGELTYPVQDDMVVIWGDGKVGITENGCFAKTFGLKKESEPIIYKGTTDPNAWLENNYQDEDGELDFFKLRLSREEVKFYKDIFIETGASEENIDAYINGEVDFEDKVDEDMIPEDGWDFLVWTQNGRSIIPMEIIDTPVDFNNIPPVKSMGILNRDEGRDAAMPGIVRFTGPEQAAGYFMLGETSKTSAAGKERGKTRSPFTQPFFPQSMGLQAKRFSELAKVLGPEVVMWLMNTGYVGGDANDEEEGNALKVKIRHSSAMLEAMLRGDIVWKTDPDFGYEVVDIDDPANKPLLEEVPAEILNPIVFYEKNGRMDEYRRWVEQMLKNREEFLESYDVDEDIVDEVCKP